MIFINRSSSSKDHSGDSITLLVISWGAKQGVFQKSVAKRDVSQKSVKGSEDGGDGLRIYEDVDHNVEGFGEPLCEMDRSLCGTILEIRFLRVFARKRCLSIYLYI
ncbi:unnamed protein product [Rhizophagus irregularis]|nr:unnamed protein product [Rhizophagus irregularis]CAB5216291.1 unnamed protein product [Rhizophagus irregularis]